MLEGSANHRNLVVFTLVVAMLMAAVMAAFKAACCVCEATKQFCFGCLLSSER